MLRADVPLCPNTPGIWSHINGWEVVGAVFVIAVCWAVVSVARFHYMAQMARRDKSPDEP